MTEHLRLIAKQLTHLKRMCEYVEYSAQRAKHILPINNWQTLSMEQHEILAAFRVRFSEFQEHLGKTMRATAGIDNVLPEINKILCRCIWSQARMSSTVHIYTPA